MHHAAGDCVTERRRPRRVLPTHERLLDHPAGPVAVHFREPVLRRHRGILPPAPSQCEFAVGHQLVMRGSIRGCYQAHRLRNGFTAAARPLRENTASIGGLPGAVSTRVKVDPGPSTIAA